MTRARWYVPAISLALVGACLPVWAQTTTQTTTTTTTTVTTATAGDPYAYATSVDLPSGAYADAARVHALQVINDADLSSRDIRRVLPLLMDLRDNNRAFRYHAAAIQGDLEVRHGTVSGTDDLVRAEDAWRSRRDSIWNTVSDRIGADKASRLRGLVEFPSNYDMPMTAYWDSMHRVDTLLDQWQALEAARIAGTSGSTTTETTGATGGPTTTTTTVETVTRIPLDAPVTTSALPLLVTPTDLVDMLETKLVARGADPATMLLWDPRRQDLDDAQLTWFQNRRTWMWK